MTESWEQMISRHKRERNLFMKAAMASEEVDFALLAEQLATPSSKMMGTVINLAAEFGYSFEKITGRSRGAKIVRARHACFWQLRNMGYSLTNIGGIFNRDHTSVINGCRRIDELINEGKKDE